MSVIASWNDTERAALRRALNAVERSEHRWDTRRQVGMNDDELLEAIGYEFGIEGGASYPMWYCYKGGNHPGFWLNISRIGRPTLQGKELINAVRELLGIPTPIEARSGRQLNLFQEVV